MIEDRAIAIAAFKERVTRFLDTFVENDTGGWTTVSADDFAETDRIIHELIDLKFARDPDSDRTIEHRLVDRTKGRLKSYFVPYEPDMVCRRQNRLNGTRNEPTDAEVREYERQTLTAICLATSFASREAELLNDYQCEQNRTRDAKQAHEIMINDFAAFLTTASVDSARVELQRLIDLTKSSVDLDAMFLTRFEYFEKEQRTAFFEQIRAATTIDDMRAARPAIVEFAEKHGRLFSISPRMRFNEKLRQIAISDETWYSLMIERHTHV